MNQQLKRSALDFLEQLVGTSIRYKFYTSQGWSEGVIGEVGSDFVKLDHSSGSFTVIMLSAIAKFTAQA